MDSEIHVRRDTASNVDPQVIKLKVHILAPPFLLLTNILDRFRAVLSSGDSPFQSYVCSDPTELSDKLQSAMKASVLKSQKSFFIVVCVGCDSNTLSHVKNFGRYILTDLQRLGYSGSLQENGEETVEEWSSGDLSSALAAPLSNEQLKTKLNDFDLIVQTSPNQTSYEALDITYGTDLALRYLEHESVMSFGDVMDDWKMRMNDLQVYLQEASSSAVSQDYWILTHYLECPLTHKKVSQWSSSDYVCYLSSTPRWDSTCEKLSYLLHQETAAQKFKTLPKPDLDSSCDQHNRCDWFKVQSTDDPLVRVTYLFFVGLPGSGKSYLSTLVFQHYKAYFPSDHLHDKDQNDPFVYLAKMNADQENPIEKDSLPFHIVALFRQDSYTCAALQKLQRSNSNNRLYTEAREQGKSQKRKDIQWLFQHLVLPSLLAQIKLATERSKTSKCPQSPDPVNVLLILDQNITATAVSKKYYQFHQDLTQFNAILTQYLLLTKSVYHPYIPRATVSFRICLLISGSSHQWESSDKVSCTSLDMEPYTLNLVDQPLKPSWDFLWSPSTVIDSLYSAYTRASHQTLTRDICVHIILSFLFVSPKWKGFFTSCSESFLSKHPVAPYQAFFFSPLWPNLEDVKWYHQLHYHIMEILKSQDFVPFEISSATSSHYQAIGELIGAKKQFTSQHLDRFHGFQHNASQCVQRLCQVLNIFSSLSHSVVDDGFRSVVFPSSSSRRFLKKTLPRELIFFLAVKKNEMFSHLQSLVSNFMVQQLEKKSVNEEKNKNNEMYWITSPQLLLYKTQNIATAKFHLTSDFSSTLPSLVAFYDDLTQNLHCLCKCTHWLYSLNDLMVFVLLQLCPTSLSTPHFQHSSLPSSEMLTDGFPLLVGVARKVKPTVYQGIINRIHSFRVSDTSGFELSPHSTKNLLDTWLPEATFALKSLSPPQPAVRDSHELDQGGALWPTLFFRLIGRNLTGYFVRLDIFTERFMSPMVNRFCVAIDFSSQTTLYSRHLATKRSIKGNLAYGELLQVLKEQGKDEK